MLRCTTPGVYFEATFTIEWRPALRTRLNLEDLVLSQTVSRAGEVAQRFEAVEVRTAQDTINAELGTPHHTRAAGYRCLAAHVDLALSAAARENVAQQRADEARVRRLRFLRTHLYEHPDLFVLDRIEQQAGFLDPRQVADWQRLARSIAATGQWWQPVLEQWEMVGQGFADIELQNRAMLALHDALRRLNGEAPPDRSPSARNGPVPVKGDVEGPAA
jgi:hypothetical protein